MKNPNYIWFIGHANINNLSMFRQMAQSKKVCPIPGISTRICRAGRADDGLPRASTHWGFNKGIQPSTSNDSQDSAQFKEQHGTLMELTRVVEGWDAERKSQMDTLTKSMTELAENVRTIAQARVPLAQQELTKDIGRNAVRCQRAADKLTDLILNV